MNSHINKWVARILSVTGITFVVLMTIFFFSGMGSFLSSASVYEPPPSPQPTTQPKSSQVAPSPPPSPIPSPAEQTEVPYPTEQTSPLPSSTVSPSAPTTPSSPLPSPRGATVRKTTPSPSPSLVPAQPSTETAPQETTGVGESTLKELSESVKTTPVKGDFNNDGQISISDVTSLLTKFIAQGATPTASELQKLDINEDNKIDVEDIKLATLAAVNAEKIFFVPTQERGGDLDNDSKITENDAKLCMKYLTEKNLSANLQKQTDIDQDGKVDSGDCTIIATIAAKTKATNPEFATSESRKGSGDFNGNGILEVSEAEKINKIAANLAPATAEEKRIADINGDGKVTASDGTLALIIAKTEKGDVDKNGKLEPADVNKLMRIALGLETADEATKKIADMDDNGEVNAATDSLILLRKIVGLAADKKTEILQGDVNGDGVLDVKDLEEANRLKISGVTPDSEQLKRVDFNEDGKYDQKDFYAIVEFLHNLLTSTVKPHALQSGDANGDGALTMEDVELVVTFITGKKTPTPEQKDAVDMNKDGKITVEDKNLMLKSLAATTKPEPAKAPAKPTSPVLGDVDKNGKITVGDATLILRKALGLVPKTTEDEKIADANNNGKLDVGDAVRALRIALGLAEPIPRTTEEKTPTTTGKVLVGDLNKDGKINSQDMTMLAQIVRNPEKATPEQRKLADINGDGAIDEADVKAILAMVVGLAPVKALSTQPPSSPQPSPPSPEKTSVATGDLNKDGKLTDEDLNILLKKATGKDNVTKEDLVIADFNKDGKLTMSDATVLLQMIQKQNPQYTIGDLNGDGKVDGEDVKLALEIAVGKNKPTEAQLKAGDINGDGKITMSDVLAIQRISLANLPSLSQQPPQTEGAEVTAAAPQPPAAAPSKTTKAVSAGLSNAGSNVLPILLLSFLISLAVSGIWWAISKK